MVARELGAVVIVDFLFPKVGIAIGLEGLTGSGIGQGDDVAIVVMDNAILIPFDLDEGGGADFCPFAKAKGAEVGDRA